jgi:hypothetical protein
MLLGIILLGFGLVGLLVKAERYNVHRQSFTGHPLRWGPYILMIVGSFLILLHVIKRYVIGLILIKIIFLPLENLLNLFS